MRPLTTLESQALLVAAKAINCRPEHLKAVIAFESSWDPLARNERSGARGLIQFMPATARDMGFDSADQLVVLLPTCEAQLCGPVIRHFRSIGGTFNTLQAICMGIFYPAYRYESPTRAFPEGVQRANPGIKTVGDYVSRVQARLA